QPAVRACVRQHTDREPLPGDGIDPLLGELDEADADGHGSSPHGAIARTVHGAQPNLVRPRTNSPPVDPSKPDELAFELLELALHALPTVDEHDGARALLDRLTA